VTGIARSTINRGIDEIEERRSAGEGRVRRPGGASTRGDPMSPLLWTSLRNPDGRTSFF
jgi:hypothetical protein